MSALTSSLSAIMLLQDDTRIKKLIEYCDNNAQKQFLSHRMAKVWNSLPAGVIDFTNSVSFRTSQQKNYLRLSARS